MLLTTIKLVGVSALLLFVGEGEGEGEGDSPPVVESVDSDGDGVDDADDLCPGSDDTVDLNSNDVPDCDETAGPNLMFDTAGSVGNATIHPNSVGSHGSMDAMGWSGSGGLWLTSSLANITAAMSVCVNVPVFYDTFELWFQSRTAWTPNAPAYAEIRQYTGKGCTGSSGINGNYVNLGNGGTSNVPWPTYSHEVPLLTSTRSVLVGITMGTDQPWTIDNILLLPIIEALGNDDPPVMN